MQQTETYKTQEVVNKVFIKGRIATLREINGTPVFTIVSKNGSRTIFVRMSCAKSVMPEDLKNKRHARVNIEGHIESYRAKRNEEGKRRIVQHFVADKIEPSKTLTDEIFGVMNNRLARLRSLQLMNMLQPFLQADILTPSRARKIVEEFVSGRTDELDNLVNSPDVPMQFESCLKIIKNFKEETLC